MKAERLNPEPKFVPVVLTLETQEEVDAIFALLNHYPLRACVGLPKGIAYMLSDFKSSYRSDRLHTELCGIVKSK